MQYYSIETTVKELKEQNIKCCTFSFDGETLVITSSKGVFKYNQISFMENDVEQGKVSFFFSNTMNNIIFVKLSNEEAQEALSSREKTLVAFEIEKIKDVDADNIRYAIEISILAKGTTAKAIPIVIKDREVNHIVSSNTFHFWDEDLEEILSTYNIDLDDIRDALENREYSIEVA